MMRDSCLTDKEGGENESREGEGVEAQFRWHVEACTHGEDERQNEKRVVNRKIVLH
jgi:hypothetical protein